jgi:hypothetical protein
MNDENREVRPLEGLSLQERFEVRRAVYGGRAVWDPRLASAAAAHARQLSARPPRWSRHWFRSFVLLDPFDVPPFVVFSLALLTIWPSLTTLGLVAGGVLLLAAMTKRRRRRKARRAEAANLRLLQGDTRDLRRSRFYGRDGLLHGAPPYPGWQWVLVAIAFGGFPFVYFAVITGFRALEFQAILWAIAGVSMAFAVRWQIVRRERRQRTRSPKT